MEQQKRIERYKVEPYVVSADVTRRRPIPVGAAGPGTLARRAGFTGLPLRPSLAFDVRGHFSTSNRVFQGLGLGTS